MKLTADLVVLKPGLLLAHMYGEDLNTALHEFTSDDTGYALPGLRHHLWHSFQYVISTNKWGWVTVDALQVVGARGEVK